MELLTLSHYPTVIADVQRQILTQEQRIRQLKYQLAEFDMKIEQAIADNPKLRNDQLRDAKRKEWKNSQKYLDIVTHKEEAEDQRQALKIQLEQLKAQFEVEKLLIRERVAALENC
jgi:DNA-directed RNA polymerase specialized sigma54-like protein